MAEDEIQESIVSLPIDAQTLATWTAVAKPVAVKRILERSLGSLQFYPSEAAALSAGALTGLPGRNDLTGVNVAEKFAARIAAHIPAESTA